MSYDLILGDRAYSSWSLRGWLLFENFGLAARTQFVSFIGGQAGWAALAPHAPARTVPTLISPEGAVVSDSLAIAEELATRHPGAGIWPQNARARATARTLAAEMHAGFAALRSDCPMNLRCAYAGYVPPPEVAADVARIEAIWTHALDTFGGPWLTGAYSAADAFFAPVAARIATYGLSVSPRARAYVDAHLADPAFRRWRAMALVAGPDLPWYARDLERIDWPGPRPLPADAAGTGPAENAACPYSGRPVTHFLGFGGRTWGFCNAFCRDKTAADPGAWPAFMAMAGSASSG